MCPVAFDGTMKPDGVLPLVGMNAERQRLTAALRQHESLLLVGPAGAGKSRLLASCIKGEKAEQDVIAIGYRAVTHDLLMSLACALSDAKHPGFARLVPHAVGQHRWAREQTSMHLRGLLRTALFEDPRVIVLDGINKAGFRTFRFLEQFSYREGMAWIGAARSERDLGALRRLFWDPRKTLRIKPLDDREAAQLFETAADHFRLRHLDLGPFRQRVLESAGGNPGQIVEMCRLASQPQYISGRYIKFAPLRIDTKMRFAG